VRLCALSQGVIKQETCSTPSRAKVKMPTATASRLPRWPRSETNPGPMRSGTPACDQAAEGHGLGYRAQPDQAAEIVLRFVARHRAWPAASRSFRSESRPQRARAVEDRGSPHRAADALKGRNSTLHVDDMRLDLTTRICSPQTSTASDAPRYTRR